MKRLGVLMLVLLGIGSSCVGVGAGAGAGSGPAGLTLSVSGPTEVVGIPAPRYMITATIVNGSGTTATGVNVSSTFPDGDAREEISGVSGCDSTGLNIDICLVPDIPPGGSAVVKWRYAPTEYGIDRHHLAVTSISPAMSDEADHDVRVLGPPNSTDWRVVVTPAVGMGGLRARHQVIVTNLGPAAATNVVLDEQLQPGEQLVSTSLGQSCSVLPAVVRCAVGTLAARASFTLVVDTKLPPNPSDAPHVVGVGSDTPAVSASHLSGSAPAVGPWRYWLCAECESTTFSDGFELPSGFTVLPDETVQVSDGSVIRRDGVLERTDGKLVLSDGTITTPPASPPGAPTGVAASAADGGALVSFDAPPSNGFPITSYTVRAEPGGYVYSGAASPITAVGLTNGTSYTFTVTAANGAGSGPASAPANAPPPLAVPAPPTGVTAVAGDGHATVTFSPSPSGAVSYYTATAFPGGKTTNGLESPITVTGLKNGISYTISVSATNMSGSGPESAPSGVVVPVENARPDTDPPAVEPRAATPALPPVSAPRPALPGH